MGAFKIQPGAILSKTRSLVRLEGGRGKKKNETTILKTTEPRQKSNQTPVIKMLMFTCRLSRRRLLFVCLHVFRLVGLRCRGGGGGGSGARAAPRDSGCDDECGAFVRLAQGARRKSSLHIEKDGGAAPH